MSGSDLTDTMAFSHSSTKIAIKGSVLSADCRRIDGSYHTSTLDLSTCLSNNNGTLVWAQNGNFWKTADSSILIEPATFQCKCIRINGFSETSSINLDEKIANDNGILTAHL